MNLSDEEKRNWKEMDAVYYIRTNPGKDTVHNEL